MRVQEEILAISFSEEEIVDGRIETLEKDLKPLLKRKRDLQTGIQNDVAKLLAKGKKKNLEDELSKIMEDMEVAKK
ncbi:hypothetical protein A2U01_0022160, partial [Trifolium medium]|nr:hypothetical protein [Trifolium medium]